MTLEPEEDDEENTLLDLSFSQACALYPPEDNRRAAALLLNLAQALLNAPHSPGEASFTAALEAATVNPPQFTLLIIQLGISSFKLAC